MCVQVYWSDVGGQEEVKRRLREAVEWPLKHPEVTLSFIILHHPFSLAFQFFSLLFPHSYGMSSACISSGFKSDCFHLKYYFPTC